MYEGPVAVVPYTLIPIPADISGDFSRALNI